MRGLCDTNVLARAATRPGGPAHEVVRHLLDDPRHDLIITPYLLDELTRVLGYVRVRIRSVATAEEIAQFLDDLEQGAELVDPPDVQPAVPHDPGDDPVIAGAVAGHAAVLCSRDRHLYDPAVRTYCEQHGIEIMDDIALLGRLRAADSESS